MLKDLDNCFYCQNLRTNSQKIGRCSFCGVVNPLYLVNYQGSQKLFCCGCAWWQFPRTEQEKVEENKWYQAWKKSTICQPPNPPPRK